METEEITTCPICGSKSFEHYLTAKDYTVTHEKFHLKKCGHCNFVITSPRPTINAIGKYYASENYISHSGKSKTLFDKLYLTARNITLQWKHDLLTQYAKKQDLILDYGCGTGDFLSYIKSKDFKVVGVEPNQKARQNANLKLENKVYEQLQTTDNVHPQIITLWHVLEHVHDLNETLQKLKNHLAKTGHIIIAVPNRDSHDSQKYKNTWAGYDVPRHLWHFNQKNMNNLLNKNGFKIVAIKPMKLDSYYVSLLSEQYLNPTQSKLITSLKAFLAGMSSNLTARRNNDYSSLIYIARPE